MSERLLAGEAGAHDVELSLRPQHLDEYIGQETVREQLRVFLTAAQKRSESLDHVLLFGPPGLGKTTLAHIIAREMGAQLHVTSGPVIEKPGDLAALLTKLNHQDVLFIDEIHRLSPVMEEVLYPALEDYQLDIVIGEGPAAQSVKIELAPFTLVGATTKAGLLTSPLRDRFGIVQRLEYYSITELQVIVDRSARLMGVPCLPQGAEEIAQRSRGTPRIANRLLRRVRDYAQVLGDGTISADLAAQALGMLEVDAAGLDHIDRRFLQVLVERFSGGPVGLETLAVALSEERGTLEDVIEPYLVQQGFVMRTPRGRVATDNAYLHLGLVPSGKLL